MKWTSWRRGHNGGRPARRRQELEEFLARVFPGEDGERTRDRLRLIVLGVLLQFPDHARVAGFARARGLGPREAEAFLLGDVTAGLGADALAGMLADCGAGPATIEVARRLCEEIRRAPGPPPDGPPDEPGDGAGPAGEDPACRNPPSDAAAAPRPGGPEIAPRPVVDAESRAEPEPAPDAAARARPPGAGDVPSAAGVPRAAEDGAEALPGLKPDPATAGTAAELMDLLQAYRVWKGRRSFRKMAAAIGHRYAHSTLSALPARRTLGNLELVLAFIEGCGGDAADLRAWEQAWQRIALAEPRRPPPGPARDEP